MRPDQAIVSWEGETRELAEGLTLVRCGGHFVGGFEDGPLGAFHASVTSRFRDAYHEPAKSEQFGPAKVELTVDANGGVRSYRLAQSSGSSVNDQALLAAAEVVKQRGVGAPPDSKARVVSVNFVPY